MFDSHEFIDNGFEADVFDNLSICCVCEDRYVYNGDTCSECQHQQMVDHFDGEQYDGERESLICDYCGYSIEDMLAPCPSCGAGGLG